jgi:hypothetical protein
MVAYLPLNNNNASLILLSTIRLNYQQFGIAKRPLYHRKSTCLNLVIAVINIALLTGKHPYSILVGYVDCFIGFHVERNLLEDCKNLI